ncbi:MAG TPA: DUF389 domain-containing protein [Pyrinomonadaceae bacterium]|nr:DUF389 domain-containing protein [Pyrinomonadaceae bacterium]
MAEKGSKWLRYLRLATSLRGGTDVEGTIEDVRRNVALRGANIWLLVCSTLLASIGLDLNSTAVIIGAMLISPLMSPILGVGLGIAILDRALLRSALGNLARATVISLIVSTVYFLVSPLGSLTQELEARTVPTLLDVGVAFFGGIAGIVAGSRKDKTAAIPGVAIATALMPPICTTGFGIANWDTTVFLGAFYLYFINAFFIATATYLIAIMLRFPKCATAGNEEDTKVKWAIIGFTVLLTVPSAFIFYNVIQKARFDRGVRNFVNNELRRDDRQPIRWDVLPGPGDGSLKVYMVGTAVSEDQHAELVRTMGAYRIGHLELRLVQMNLSPDEFRRVASNVETTVADSIRLMSEIETERDREIAALKDQLHEMNNKYDPELVFLRRTRSIFPVIAEATWDTSPASESDSLPARRLLISFRPETTAKQKADVTLELLRLAETAWPGENTEVREIEVSSPDAPSQ